MASCRRRTIVLAAREENCIRPSRRSSSPSPSSILLPASASSWSSEMMTLWMIGLDLRSLVSGLIGIALSDDSAQMVVSFLSLACRVVKGAALLDKFEGQFLSKCMIAKEGIFCWSSRFNDKSQLMDKTRSAISSDTMRRRKFMARCVDYSL